MLARGVSSLRRAGHLTGIARSALYYHSRPGSVHRPRAEEPKMRALVRRVALAHPTFGSRRVWAVLRFGEDRYVSWKRVRRLLQVEGLQHERHFPRPRVPESGNLTAARPNERWYTDLTYIDTTDEGPVPLMSILDGCTREVVAFELFRLCGAREALSVVQRATFERFPTTGRAPGTFLVTDGGPQFVAEKFREGARQLGLVPRPTRKRRPEDNGMIESFQGHFKHDYLWIREPGSYIETQIWVREGMTDYNTSRPHSSLGYLSPVEYARRRTTEIKP
ncbi:MAG: IS3 family transposase [Thermoplasmata archaeon]